jgi:hypothetical protein
MGEGFASRVFGEFARRGRIATDAGIVLDRWTKANKVDGFF